ncbi:AraC family transcriptional regulator [Paenibacillus sp. JDR-2]|uniref:AraC family transcriptional regulator n=1 Tax=Paenibacillus sp. (strain JDR-2) TaxID=324057 RepID=UPI00016659D9|nr:AraC family transcriptional regulator [Paenibacillus sp. JDR-2]ACT01666.1 transcriptional regulator, AraC family [Paenibacillus sp. JDR-2]
MTDFIVSLERFAASAEMSSYPYKSHSHEYEELTMIDEGEGYYSSPDRNRKVGPGDLIYIPSGLLHSYVCTKRWQGVSVHFRKDKLPVQCQQYLQQERGMAQLEVAALSHIDRRWARASLVQLERRWKEAEAAVDAEVLQRVAIETALSLFQANKRESSNSHDHTNIQSVMREVLREIHARFDSPITVHELASRHYLSESHLRKQFSAAIGVSPKQYIIRLRLKEAQRLLKQTDKAIETISAEVGFHSSSRFYDFFFKSVGMTPLEWRRQCVAAMNLNA